MSPRTEGRCLLLLFGKAAGGGGWRGELQAVLEAASGVCEF